MRTMIANTIAANRFVLIIDDDLSILQIAKLSLKRSAGWKVATASSGAAGIALAETEQPDAILLDVMMPSIDGLATLEKLKASATACHIPVIFLTAKTHASDRHKFYLAGGKGLIAKPFEPEDLAAQIENFLEWS